MKIPITQSRAWQKLQNDLGEKSFLVSENGYQYLAILKSTPTGNYLYCPYGPVAEGKSSFKKALDSLERLGREQQAVFLRIEPFEQEYADILPKNSQKSLDLNPQETWLLDLTGSEEELTQKLPSRLLRYYKSAPKKGITIEESHNPDDIHYLYDLQQTLAKEKGINTFSLNYLKTELKQPFATLYLVKHRAETSVSSTGDALGGGSPKMPSFLGEESAAGPVESKVIAAGLVFDDETTRYNLQGAQSDEGRALHATGILTIQLIKDAKKKNLQTFDFWGIAPEGAPDNHPWAGFTNFKKTFAGYEYDHAGTYDIILKPAKYKMYQALRKIRRLV